MKKNFIKIIALVLMLASVCTVLVSCGKTLSGKYSAEVLGTGVTMTFSGNKVTTSYKTVGIELYSVEGTYEISDGQITITYEGEDAAEAEDYAGTLDFEELEDGSIKIGLFTLKKADA